LASGAIASLTLRRALPSIVVTSAAGRQTCPQCAQPLRPGREPALAVKPDAQEGAPPAQTSAWLQDVAGLLIPVYEEEGARVYRLAD
jgi:hypothetical protein